MVPSCANKAYSGSSEITATKAIFKGREEECFIAV